MMFFKTKRISIILLFIVSTMLIGIFAGCGRIVYDSYSISRAELVEINTAWDNRWVGDTVFAEKRKDIKYQERGYAVLYKKYNDCMVLFCQEDASWYSESLIAGYKFKRPGCKIWVCKDSTYYTLEDAYDNKILTEEQIAEIYVIHNKVLGYE